MRLSMFLHWLVNVHTYKGGANDLFFDQISVFGCSGFVRGFKFFCASAGCGCRQVNGVEIKESDLATAEEDLGPNLPPMTAEAKRDY